MATKNKQKPNHKGFTKISKDMEDHWLRSDMWEYGAFITLLEQVIFRGTAKQFRRGGVVEIPRGSVLRSRKELAELWKCGEGKARGFLAKLVAQGEILISTTSNVTLITLCNYNEWVHEGNRDQPEVSPTTRHLTRHSTRHLVGSSIGDNLETKLEGDGLQPDIQPEPNQNLTRTPPQSGAGSESTEAQECIDSNTNTINLPTNGSAPGRGEDEDKERGMEKQIHAKEEEKPNHAKGGLKVRCPDERRKKCVWCGEMFKPEKGKEYHQYCTLICRDKKDRFVLRKEQLACRLPPEEFKELGELNKGYTSRFKPLQAILIKTCKTCSENGGDCGRTDYNPTDYIIGNCESMCPQGKTAEQESQIGPMENPERYLELQKKNRRLDHQLRLLVAGPLQQKGQEQEETEEEQEEVVVSTVQQMSAEEMLAAEERMDDNLDHCNECEFNTTFNTTASPGTCTKSNRSCHDVAYRLACPNGYWTKRNPTNGNDKTNNLHSAV